MANASPFLGAGWGFPIAPDASGALAVSTDERSVQESIGLILSTAKGERAMRGNFGCGIHDLVFERNTAATAGKVTQAVRDALLRFEPRIQLVDVRVDDRGGGEVMNINIDYVVRTTNTAFNFVFPFYLDRSGQR
jgi:phage baseplate assembly protein W